MLAACANDEPAPAPVPTPPAGETPEVQPPREGPFVVGFSNASPGNPWSAAMEDTMRHVAAENSDFIQLIITDANDDPLRQLADLEDLLAQNVDLLMVRPVVQDALQPIIDRTAAQGIPLVVVGRTIGGTGYTAFVETPQYMIGSVAAQALIDYFDGVANVTYIAGFPGSGSDVDRSAGFYAYLEDHPGIVVLAEQPGNWQEAGALHAMENLIQGFPHMDAVVASDGTTAISAARAIRAAGADIPIFIMDNTRNDSMQLLLDGYVVSFSTQNPVYTGAWAVHVAIELLRGRELNTTHIVIPPPRIDITNVEGFMDLALGDAGFPWLGLYQHSMEHYFDQYWVN
jgi:ribose transport system substrate-binding protein